MALAAAPSTNCANGRPRKIKSCRRWTRKPTSINGMMLTPRGFAESESNPNPPRTASKRHCHRFAAQGGENHQAGQQINLRAQQIARRGKDRFRKHRQKSEGQYQNGLQADSWFHGFRIHQNPDFFERAEVGIEFDARVRWRGRIQWTGRPRFFRSECLSGKSRPGRW